MTKRAQHHTRSGATAPDLAEIVRRFGPGIAPVTISRLPVFAPVGRRPARESTATVETPWGRVQVTGRLSQHHRQLLDAAVATAVAIRLTEDGGVHLVIEPYQIMRLMDSRSWDYRWLEGLLADLRRAEVRIEENGHEFPLLVTGILTSFGRVPREKENRGGIGRRVSHRSDPGSEDLIQLTISGAWWGMWRDRPVAHYARHLAVIGRMGTVGQAVARLAVTQPRGWRIGIDRALAAVGAWDDGHTPSARQRRHHARTALTADAEALAGIGVRLADGQIEYVPPGDVWVSVPPPAEPREP